MEYFNLLDLKKEPFSNSPEPEFLFASTQHSTCLQRLELAVRLRRGLNIVIGAVGTGKTTLCRKLIQNLSVPADGDAPVIETFLLLDPAVESRLLFVKTVASILGIVDIHENDHEWQIKEKIKNFLFERGVQEQKNIVLIIDEGQKIPDDCLEILREFLNYETNSFKLLQIIIFAQPEFRKSLAARANLLDRVNYLYDLQPLSFSQTKAMIDHRISVASLNQERHRIFTFYGTLAVYIATAGYPRKIVSLCHQVLLMLIIRGKSQAGWFLVRSCISKMNGLAFKRIRWSTVGISILAVLLFATYFYLKEQPATNNLISDQRILSEIELKKESILTQASHGVDENQEKIPDYLGTIEIKKGMTIWGILENIFGDVNKEITQRFVEANPQIKNIHIMSQGDVIQVPSYQNNTFPMKPGTIIVSLENSKELEKIYYSFMKMNLNNMPTILFLSFWNKREGKRFVIALDKRFRSLEEAKEAIRRLPDGLSVSAQVLSSWDNDTVFFNSRLL